MFDGRRITAIVPARNEEANIGMVLDELISLKNSDNNLLVDQIIVCDNNSSDQTAVIAKSRAVALVFEERPAYSLACHAALDYFFQENHEDEEILFFVDADQSMRLTELPSLLAPFVSGADIVIGTRVGKQVEPGAMNFQQRWGNKLAITLINFLWKTSITDLGPFRAITAGALKTIDMHDQTFGWTTEMQVRAIQEELNMVEIPVSVLKRVGQSKISGTFGGNIGAGRAILGTIFKFWWRERR